MTRWEYGGAYLRHEMGGEIELPNRSVVKACDLTADLPAFMKEADTLFLDPPWSNGNLKSFYTKAGFRTAIQFGEFTKHLFSRVDEIGPCTLFVEIGKAALANYLNLTEARYRYVTFYNSTYYHKRGNKCYVIHGTNDRERRRYPELEDLDEEAIIEWVCRNHPYQCIGDLCMGRGLVGRYAYSNGKRFVGTELNPKRLAVLVDFIRTREHNK